MDWRRTLRHRIWPSVPAEVREAYYLAQYNQLARQVPMLYCALILITFAAMACADPTDHPLIRLGIPMGVELMFCARLVVWLRRPQEAISADQARRVIRTTNGISITAGALCAAWSIQGWATAAPDRAMYFPLFMAMGSFATISSLSMSRTAGFGHIFAGLVPVTLALLTSGNPMATAAGASIATTCLFLLALLRRQHERTVEVLLLQHRMKRLADTDPLTGLINRRVLRDRLLSELEAAAGSQGPALMLLDLDGFKPVNDCYGHAAGDEVLRQVAARLTLAAAGEAEVCRMGGDEFAVLVPATARRSADVIGSAMLAALARPFIHDGNTMRVGASLGLAQWDRDGASIEALFESADRALYAAKAQHGSDAASAPAPQAVRKAWVIG
ncbi:MAG: diguanylate cyclase [Sphingomonadales bacterium]|nr:diguanylate cyclase [Sphingomonadales bacterium]